MLSFARSVKEDWDMKPKWKHSVLGGVLALSISFLLFGPVNLLQSSTREFEDCGPIELTQIAYDNVVCQSGNPNINAEKDLIEDSPEIMSLESNATASQIQSAFCADAIADSSNGQISFNAYEYKYAQNRWENKHKSVEELDKLLYEGSYCGDYWAAKDEYRLANLTMEERYRDCTNFKDSLKRMYLSVAQSLYKDDLELWGWFVFTNTIKENRRDKLSQASINLINEYKEIFDKYQIYQCELNFPILKDPVPQSNGQEIVPWTPSAIV
jgi:hypothetical protein